MSELLLHRAAIAPQLMLAELGRVCFELILCVVILVLALAKCTPKPNEPNDPEDQFYLCKHSKIFHYRSCHHIKHSRETDQGDQDVHRLQEETQDGVSRGILYKLRAGTEWLTKCAYVEHLRYVFECFRWFPVVKHLRGFSCCQASPRVHTRGPCSSEIVMFRVPSKGFNTNE